jgi:hypothetical protein
MLVAEKPAAKKPAAKAKTKIKTPGELIDELHALTQQKKDIDKQISALKAEIDAAQIGIIETLDSLEMTRGDGRFATASISESVVPNVEDWDAAWKYIYKNKADHLVQRRISTEAYREEAERKGGVPGITPFVKRTLNLRTK